MCFNQRGDISTLKGGALKLVENFTSLGSSISSTGNDINKRQAKAWAAFERLSVIWKSDFSDQIKHNFFKSGVMSILLYGWTTWTLIKHIEKKFDNNYTRILRAVLKSPGSNSPQKQLFRLFQVPVINLSLFLFYVVFESSYRCIETILNPSEAFSSLFAWHI